MCIGIANKFYCLAHFVLDYMSRFHSNNIREQAFVGMITKCMSDNILEKEFISKWFFDVAKRSRLF